MFMMEEEAKDADKKYDWKEARTGFEPAIFGLRDRRLTTWPPRLRLTGVFTMKVFSNLIVERYFVTKLFVDTSS